MHQPQDAEFPITVDLQADGTSRLMMDLPSQLTATWATKRLAFANATERKAFKLAIRSKRGPGVAIAPTPGSRTASARIWPPLRPVPSMVFAINRLGYTSP